MFEKMICRNCANNNSARLDTKRRPFAIAGASPHYAPDRPFKLEHIALDLKVNPITRALAGAVVQRMKVISPGQKIIRLDQMGLHIEEVRVFGSIASFSVQDHSLLIELEIEPTPEEFLEVEIKYQVNNPKRGIYFTGPDCDYPHKPYQVWTQGQDEDSQYWFPTLDYPNQKATSEIKVAVPKGFTAVSNGALIEQKETEQGAWFHYRLGTPHVTYLISLVIAEFSEWSDRGPRGLPVQYYVQPGWQEDGKRAFENTPKMIEAFEKKTGIPYPYEKYSQVAVQDFIFGGMENTSATTQTDLTLHDERAHLDFSSDPLVAHELAHQWFGDLITCRDWSHAWLNEGFATFMERVWIEAKEGIGGGIDEAKYYSYQDLNEYLSDDQGRYRRPIVCNTYIEPIDLFDTHLYQKGGLVVNLIRSVLGEELFWKSIHLYLSRHRGQSVETQDLIRAIEDATGRNLRRLFDEWVFGTGYPEFEITYQWHESRKMTEWVIEQKQTGGQSSKTEDGVTISLFHLPVKFEMMLKNGEKISHQIELGEVRERIFIPAPSRPTRVRFDPDFTIPKKLKFPRPKDMLLEQLFQDSDCMGRIEAAQELINIADREVILALGKSIAHDSFWGVKAESAKALAKIRTDLAQEQLIQALEILRSTNQFKARRAIVNALGEFHNEKSAQILKTYAERDLSYFVEADSTSAWASAMLKPQGFLDASQALEVEEFLIQQLNKQSYREVIRAASLTALAKLPGMGQGKHSRALESIIEWSKRGKPLDARMAAVDSLGRILKNASGCVRAQILKVLDELSNEDHFRLRRQLVGVLENSDCVEGIPILSRIRQLDTDGRIKRSAQVAIDHLISTGALPDAIIQLKDALEKLEEEHNKLRSRFEEKGSIQ